LSITLRYWGFYTDQDGDPVIAVGTALSGGPPHRSQRALLTHWAPASDSNVEALTWEWVLHTGWG